MESIALRSILFAALVMPVAATAAEIVVYKQSAFAGDTLALQGNAATLVPRNFHDQISSIVVKSGRWEVCTQPNYRGDCAVLEPGEYASLDARLNHRIESIREAPAYALAPRRESPAQRLAAVELFPAARFAGTPTPVHEDHEAMHPVAGALPVGSVVVREGKWQLCSDRGFEGVCRVYEAGRHADLERLNNQVGSVRRVGAARAALP